MKILKELEGNTIIYINESEMKGIYKDKDKTIYFKLIETNPNYESKESVKCIENLSLDEMKNLMPNISEDVIEITYNYLHKTYSLNSIGFAYRNHISESTLFRYLRKVKKEYKKITNDSF